MPIHLLQKTHCSTAWAVLFGLSTCLLVTTALRAQVRPLHTRDLVRLSQIQVTEQLKKSDVVFIPVGSVETNGISPSGRDYVSALGYAMAMADEVGGLYMPGLIWSYPGTTLVATSTINITPTQGISFLRAVSESLIRSGFRRLVFVSSGHGPAPMTAGVVVRELFDAFHTPLLYLEMGGHLARMKVPAQSRNRLVYGTHSITGRLIDLPLKGDYGDGPSEPVPTNPGMAELARLGYTGRDAPNTGSLSVGSWVTDWRSHGGGGNQMLPATEAEREQWGKEGEAQLRAIVKQMKLIEAVEALKKHDDYTNQVLVPKYEKILPPLP